MQTQMVFSLYRKYRLVIMFDERSDTYIRLATFGFLEEHQADFGDVLPRAVLAEGFILNGERICVIGPQGIFKPKAMQLPLSVTTSPNGPYNDDFTPDFLNYKYRGTDPNHPDNVGLREVMKRRLPLVYFHGLVPGQYVAHWPVYVVADSPESLTFGITFDEKSHGLFYEPELDEETIYRRRYATAEVRRRLHQRTFRERVLLAYRHSCSLCSLRHKNLLEAAHIIPDSEEKGEPLVSNGLSFCKLHHAAFDANILGIRPDYVAEIRTDVLEETDGPMLQHGLQEMHSRRIYVPHKNALRPNVEALEIRYEQFRAE